ncbi:DNA polymerase III beta subunit [Lachnospiraceae bacterium TWA4]|nr:DNA polymerase III beta subunit [Lachnospiraceae bacterium TWA4]
MKVAFIKTDLLNGLNIVSKAVASRSTSSILECVLIDAKDQEVTLTANDTTLGIETKLMAHVIEPGQIAIEARLFTEIIRKLPNSQIVLELNDSQVNITCENANFKIPYVSPEEFTSLPEIDKENYIKVSQFTLKEVIRQTIFALSINDTNPLMTGELFEVFEDQLKIIALDGHRIAIRTIMLGETYPYQKVIVPGKILNEVSKILTGEHERYVTIYFSQNHICFEFDETVVVSRLIEGEYFRIEQMLSADYITSIEANKQDLLSAIERSTLLVKESDKKPLIFTIQDQKMNLLMNSSRGTMQEDIEVVQLGDDIQIAFNPRFLIEALKAIDDERITIYTINSKAPCFIKDKDENYIYLILPVNFN